MTRRIPVRPDGFTLVDDEDYEKLVGFPWEFTGSQQRYVAYRKRVGGGKRPTFYMHRVILGLVNAPPEVQVDHINRDPSDNRKSNLRIATRSQNQVNRSGWRKLTSKYRGVSRGKAQKKWAVGLTLYGKRIGLGSYDTEEQAARAYDEAARIHFGEFACPNFPDEKEKHERRKEL